MVVPTPNENAFMVCTVQSFYAIQLQCRAKDLFFFCQLGCKAI